ncbi:hypothetical protein MNV49_000769 [Pseudohyphozyma bogoriensis]|nr:hypothetical protein MNV49_000769 [Pseudohyphozyma bogoriensis]
MIRSPRHLVLVVVATLALVIVGLSSSAFGASSTTFFVENSARLKPLFDGVVNFDWTTGRVGSADIEHSKVREVDEVAGEALEGVSLNEDASSAGVEAIVVNVGDDDGRESMEVVEAATITDDGPQTEEEPLELAPPEPTKMVKVVGKKKKAQCRRTMLFHFRGDRGFASEFNRFVRVGVVAEHYGYQVLLSEYEWMYGRFENYFKQPELPCSIEGLPGADPAKRRQIVYDEAVNGKPGWTSIDHVQDGRKLNFTYIDDLFLAITTSPETLSELHQSEILRFPPPLPLSAVDTVPPEMMRAFELQSAFARRFWVLNDETQKMVDALKAGLRWDKEDVERVVVGMHLRLGDKHLESANPKYNPLRFASPHDVKAKCAKLGSCSQKDSPAGLDANHAKTFITATQNAFAHLQSTDDGPQEAANVKKVLAIMSDDQGALKKLKKAGRGKKTGNFEALVVSEEAKKWDGAQGVGGGEEMAALDKGFNPFTFMELSLEARVALTRRFIRDLTLLAQNSDAFVFTGTSNVGRLAILLAGPEKAVGGHYISCDSRWFPSTYYN